MRGRQTVDQTLNAGGVRPAELAVLEIEIVNDFRELAQGRILQVETRAHRLERTSVAFVREVGADHVERLLAGTYRSTRRVDEAKSRRGIDESPNQPRRGEPVDVRIAPRDPDTALEFAA